MYVDDVALFINPTRGEIEAAKEIRHVFGVA